MIEHGIIDHNLIHDRIHKKTIHDDIHKKNIHSDMHFGHKSNSRSSFDIGLHKKNK